MAASCAQTNKSTTSTKEKTKQEQSNSKSDLPEVTAKIGDKSEPTTDKPTTDTKPKEETTDALPAKNTTTEPIASEIKEKKTSGTTNKKENSIQNGTDPIVFSFNERFSLRLNETAINNSTENRMEVVAIRDNRCPVGVNCFRAGEVEVDLKIDTETQIITLTFPTAEKPKSRSYHTKDDYTVKLTGASRKGRTDLSKPSGSLKSGLGGIDVYLMVNKIEATPDKE